MIKQRTLLVLGSALLALAAGSLSESDAQVVERGRYLVESVALCSQCHTPRDERGALIAGRELHGAAVPQRSPFSGERWAFRAPHIAGLPGLTDLEAIRLLTDGIAHTGKPPAAPMPRYRMTRADAEAVVAYLRALE